MTNPKEKPASSLREPKPKKTLGLRPPTMLRLPHDDLIKPEASAADARESITPVSTPASTPVTTPVSTPVTTPVTTSPSAPSDSERQAPQYLDATHTSSEAQVYSVMYRETVSKNLRERHFGPAELMKKTGIRSDRTVRRAIDGLIAKLSIEITSYNVGSPLGPRYRVYKPKEIEQRRKEAGLEIDQFTKRIITPATTPATTPVATGDKNYRGTAVSATPVTGVENAGVIKYGNDHLADSDSATTSSSNAVTQNDDEAFAGLNELFKQAAINLTGKSPTATERDRWRELAELLIAELQIAAARTGQVSNVPAFLTEHLRRRLWKKDKAQLERESREAAREPEAKQKIDASKCPDCGGSGWWYPDGPERGVKRCRHLNLPQPGQPATNMATTQPELTPAQVQEQVELLASLLRDGVSIDDLELQFAGNYQPVQWQQIRAGALKRSSFINS